MATTNVLAVVVVFLAFSAIAMGGPRRGGKQKLNRLRDEVDFLESELL